MKSRMRSKLFLVAIGAILGSAATAQFQALDPLQVAPHIFQKVLENDKLRVLKVTERNGETAPLHAHPARLQVYLSPCAWMENAGTEMARMVSYRLGDVIWQERLTHGGETSRVVQECSRLDIEIK